MLVELETDENWTGVRPPLDLESMSKEELLDIIAQVYQAVGGLADYCDVFDHPDVTRLLDTLAYGRSVEDNLELLPWPHQKDGLKR